MAMQCSIDGHADRNAIDADLALRRGSLRNIAQRHGVSAWALHRHVHNCLHMTLEQSKELAAMLSADNLLDTLSQLHDRTEKVLDTAERLGDLRTVLAAIRESRANIETFDRLAHPERAWTPTYRAELERHRRYEAEADGRAAELAARLRRSRDKADEDTLAADLRRGSEEEWAWLHADDVENNPSAHD